MADLTIHELQNEATAPAANDYMVLDGATAGTRKITPANLATWIHNKWAAFINALTAVTSFSSGDNVVMVNGTTAKKMSKDKLLELTAQNALAGNVAPAFVPNVTEALAGKPYVYNGLLYVAKEDYQGPWDATKFTAKNVFDANLILNPSIDTAPYNDLNTFPLNSIVTFTSPSIAAQNILHNPVNGQFQCYTFATYTDVRTQILSAYNGNTYVRSKWGDIWSSWKNFSNINEIVLNPSIDSAPYNDLNTFPLNSIVTFTSPSIAAQNILHNPTGKQFNCYSFGADSGVRTQILSDSSNNMFIRSKWGNVWSEWKKFNNINEIVLNPSASSAPYNDLNTFPINSIVAFTTSSIPLTNNPSGKQFHCYTFATYSDVRTQILSDSEGDTYVRSKWGGIWSKWRNLSVQGMTDVLCEFDNILFVGDSLTYSQVFTGNNVARQAKKTYPKVIEEITGSATFNLSNPGDTASDAWTRWKDTFEAKTNALAVIYLGTNQGLTDTLSVDAPEDEPYTDWADTNTGCYAKIVAKLQELGYKILLVKPYSFTSSGALYTAQLVIDEIGERFGCAVVGPIRNNERQYHYWPNLQNYDQVHYNDLGYAWFAYRLVQEVSLIGEGLKYIIPG